MKKKFLLLIILCSFQLNTYAADLVEVYHQALCSDPIFQQAVTQRLATKEGVPINVATILPNLLFTMTPALTRSSFSGSAYGLVPIGSISPRNNTARTNNMYLTLTQTIFDFAKFARIKGAIALSRGADATLNAALQDLMIRVSKAYFEVLKDEDNLAYTEASKLAYAEQLDQVREQYNVGLKTITEVYTAQASYDSARALYIAAQTTLTNDRENLRVITGRFYPHLRTLSEDFPLITPKPAEIEQWVSTALCQNWSIQASKYDVANAKQNIRQQVAGHLPTVNFQGTMDRLYTENVNAYTTLNQRQGPGTQTDRQVALNINVPLFSGGGVVAETNQAIYTYKNSQQKLEQVIRQTINTTRQSYLGVISGISQIEADKQAIKSSISSLEGMEASYNVGTETLVNVLNQQQKVFQAQTQYATDRYAFVNNILALKQAAGTLSVEDLAALNIWLIEKTNRPKLKAGHLTYTKVSALRKTKLRKKIAVKESKKV